MLFYFILLSGRQIFSLTTAKFKLYQNVFFKSLQNFPKIIGTSILSVFHSISAFSILILGIRLFWPPLLPLMISKFKQSFSMFRKINLVSLKISLKFLSKIIIASAFEVNIYMEANHSILSYLEIHFEIKRFHFLLLNYLNLWCYWRTRYKN